MLSGHSGDIILMKRSDCTETLPVWTNVANGSSLSSLLQVVLNCLLVVHDQTWIVAALGTSHARRVDSQMLILAERVA